MERWADRNGFVFPSDVIEQQGRWNKERSTGNQVYNAYIDLGQRRPFWPPEKDLAPPAPKRHAPRTTGYGEARSELTRDLNRILSWIQHHRPSLAAGLQPGLTVDAIAAQVSSLPFVLPEEAYELYHWRNGSEAHNPVTLVPYYWFMPLEEAMKRYRLLRGLRVTKYWFPVFDWNGEVMCLKCRKTEAATAAVIRYDCELGSGEGSASLTTLIRQETENYEAGRCIVDQWGRIVEAPIP